MRIYYFVFDVDEQLHRAERDTVEGFWNGSSSSNELPCTIDGEFRLITVLTDDNFMPKVCFFTRLDVEDGQITRESRIEAFKAISKRAERRYDHPAAHNQFAGWPADWQRQLAIALDVMPSELQRNIGLGGPLVMSELWGLPLEQVLEYFEKVSEK